MSEEIRKEEDMPQEIKAEEAAKNPNEISLESLQANLKEAEDKYLRVLAEAENSRKRMQKERQQQTHYAIENILVEFLHPIDCFEKALSFAETMSSDVKNWAIGFEMIVNQFKQILSNHGVEEYHSVGKRFDPHYHEAIEMIETNEYEEGIVVEEDIRGYKSADRPIRVARVKVAKAPKKEEELKEEKQKEG